MGQNQPLELSEEEKKELSIGLLREWWLAVTQSLVDEAGQEVALRHLKPYFIHSGKAGSHIFHQLTENKVRDIIPYTRAIGYVLARLMNGKWRIFYALEDNSGIGEITDCATGGACEAGCHSVCSYLSSNSVNETNPDYEMRLTRSLSFGDAECLWLVNRKGEKALVAPTREFLVLPPSDLPESMTEELVDYLCLAYLGEFWVMATRGWIDFAGSERSLERLRFYTRHSGLSLGIRMCDRMDVERKKSDSTIDLVQLIFDLHQKKGQIIRVAGSAEGVVEECPFSGAPSEICYQYEAFFNGMCEAIDPEYEFIYGHMMTKGDKTCHWTIRKKGQTASRDDAVPEDPIKVLKLRYAKGEITREEYQRMKEELLE